MNLITKHSSFKRFVISSHCSRELAIDTDLCHVRCLSMLLLNDIFFAKSRNVDTLYNWACSPLQASSYQIPPEQRNCYSEI